MKTIVALAVGLAALPAFAGTPCDAVKAKIEAKLEKKGVKNYTLDVVDAKDTREGRVVGTCDGNTKKIIYTRK
jgi:Protein of unknown function (DUF1161)